LPAGADINEFPKIRTREEASEGSRTGHELFGRIRALPFPTVAAINGACLGGGVEIALHCSARTIATSVRHFGCPEVFLGIFPAWGGTQIVPRLVGVENAIRFVVLNPLRQNKLLDAAKAVELGFADRLLDPGRVRRRVDRLRARARRVAARAREPDHGDVAKALRKGRSQTDDAVHGAAPAPYKALDLIELALSGATLEEGYRAEEEAIADLMLSPATRRSLYAYDVVERRAKQGIGIPDVPPRKLQKVGIVGAGLMATQLATLFLKRLGRAARDPRPRP
jgi:enoyl-CoA hydratase/carnithine racemase